MWVAASAQDSISFAVLTRSPTYFHQDFVYNFGKERGLGISLSITQRFGIVGGFSRFRYQRYTRETRPYPVAIGILERNHYYLEAQGRYQFLKFGQLVGHLFAGPTMLRYNDKVDDGTSFVDVYGYTFNYNIITGTKLGVISCVNIGLDLTSYLQGYIQFGYRFFDRIDRAYIYGLGMEIKIPTSVNSK